MKTFLKENVVLLVLVAILIIGIVMVRQGIRLKIDGPKIEKTVEEGVQKGIEKVPLEEIISKGVEKGNKRIVSSLNVLQKNVRIIRTEKILKETVPVPMEENRIEIPLGDADYVDIAIDNGNTFTLKKVDDYKIFPLSEGKHQVVIVSHKKSFKPIKKIVDVPYLKENEKLKLLAVE